MIAIQNPIYYVVMVLTAKQLLCHKEFLGIKTLLYGTLPYPLGLKKDAGIKHAYRVIN